MGEAQDRNEVGMAPTEPNAPTDDTSLDDEDCFGPEIEALRVEYRQTIPSLFGEIGDALVAAAQSEGPAGVDALADAHRVAHSMAGTAGSIGFIDIGNVARAMTVTLRDTLRRRRDEIQEEESNAEPAKAEAEAEAPPTADAAPTPPTLATVLVVSSDAELLDAASAMGKEVLVDIVPASSGQEACELASQRKMDAAIIDVGLASEESGSQIARDLRSVQGGAILPLAFISADTSLDNRIAATHAGVSLFLEKPLTTEALVGAVRTLVQPEVHMRPRILVVDDDEVFLQSMREILNSEDFDVEILSDPKCVLEKVTAVRPDLLLLDVLMPDVSGFEICRVLRSTDAWRGLPVLFLTMGGGEDTRTECFRAGADDFIEKPVVRAELLARINARIDRLRLHREMADRDSLTGIYSRRAFLDLCRIRLSEAQRHSVNMTLCLLDLDHFKRVNDYFGHLAGDNVLASFGRLLSSRFRAADLRGRWGGEEFVVAFLGEEAQTSALILGRMKEELGEMVFTGDHGGTFSVSFSAGLAVYPDDGGSFDELFRIADAKLMDAKRLGRNRIEV